MVAVPARNEADRLATLIAALDAQTWLDRGERLTVVVVLNGCSDGSAKLMRRLVAAHPRLDLRVIDVLLPNYEAHVGTARRMAMDAALRTHRDVTLALITTDADAAPEPGWIEANLAALAAGADLVGGRIIGDPEEEAQLGPGFRRRADRHLHHAALADRLAALLDPLPHDPLPRHGDHTGASLAVRGEVYEALGGLPALPFREDIAFVARARAAGYRLRHAPEVRVRVSARLVGRAPGGMADCLKSWIEAEAEHAPHTVEPVDRLVARLKRRRALRTGEHANDPGAALPRPDWSKDWRGFDPASPTGRVELWAGDDLDAACSTPIEDAIAVLETLLREEAEAYVDAA